VIDRHDKDVIGNGYSEESGSEQGSNGQLHLFMGEFFGALTQNVFNVVSRRAGTNLDYLHRALVLEINLLLGLTVLTLFQPSAKRLVSIDECLNATLYGIYIEGPGDAH
jgi:hypothetical protein